jgi:hypothetical protein
MAIPPQFLKGKQPQQDDPKAAAKKKKAADRLATLKTKQKGQ